MEKMDEDVMNEKKAVLSGNLPKDTAVVVSNLFKTYTSMRLGCIPGSSIGL